MSHGLWVARAVNVAQGRWQQRRSGRRARLDLSPWRYAARTHELSLDIKQICFHRLV
jgi:hypothetical protein